MEKKRIFEGKTTKEAIEKGLKYLGIKKEEAVITVLKSEDKRSFFSILDPRVVRVEISKKETLDIKKEVIVKEKRKVSKNAKEEAKKKTEKFLEAFLAKFSKEKFEISFEEDDYYLLVKISGQDTNSLIGYRGETLNAIQTILSSVVNKNSEEKVRVILDISNYKDKRKKILEELATKIAKNVIKTGKKVTLEPMPAFERKVIHAKLQENDKITTESIGEEPYRKVVIKLK